MDLRAIIEAGTEAMRPLYRDPDNGWPPITRAGLLASLRALHAQGPSAEMVEEGLQAPPSPRQIFQAMLASLIAALEPER